MKRYKVSIPLWHDYYVEAADEEEAEAIAETLNESKAEETTWGDPLATEVEGEDE